LIKKKQIRSRERYTLKMIAIRNDTRTVNSFFILYLKWFQEAVVKVRDSLRSECPGRYPSLDVGIDFIEVHDRLIFEYGGLLGHHEIPRTACATFGDPRGLYFSDRVKGLVRRALGDSVLRRKLLFDRDGGDRQIMQRVRFAKRVVGENQIGLRDGRIAGASE
jgi:hypothetical protein